VSCVVTNPNQSSDDAQSTSSRITTVLPKRSRNLAVSLNNTGIYPLLAKKRSPRPLSPCSVDIAVGPALCLPRTSSTPPPSTAPQAKFEYSMARVTAKARCGANRHEADHVFYQASRWRANSGDPQSVLLQSGEGLWPYRRANRQALLSWTRSSAGDGRFGHGGPKSVDKYQRHCRCCSKPTPSLQLLYSIAPIPGLTGAQSTAEIN